MVLSPLHSLRVVLLGLVLLSSACSPIKALNAIAPGGAQRSVGVEYGDGPRQHVDIYKPAGLQGAAPVVLFFYGGSWNSGSREDYAFVGEALAGRGIVTLIADYRLYPEVRYPEFLRDNAAALAWAVDNVAEYGGDPQRIFLMGHSSGAYNAAMLALDPRWRTEVGVRDDVIKGWIGLAGAYDFLPIENPEVKPVFFHPHSPRDSQPINQVHAGAPPALLMAANDDDLVDPQRNSEGLARRLRDAGVPVQERYYSRPDHRTLVASLTWPLRWLAPTLDESVAFIHSTAP